MHIDEIQNGIVLDHITAGKAMEIYHFLELDGRDCPVAILQNVGSRKMGRKDIIKIDAPIDTDLNVLAVLCPGITVNVIRNGVRVEKKALTLPPEVKDVIKCKNPRCITTTEQELPHVFRLTGAKTPVYRCIYCETKA
ncbi:MAG: aspartate carbamoyltransferase regulatory subunit [Clostridia bacterium]|jgi:aspartate carbamoyltransferase regulatory subunit|nr:aspartate carbamoyltransferase regulatory subunit [Clostridia bacterium]MBQ5773116.1 aspartate carbamoyltransferase regulatory subunit [Clostridia bacterium]